MRCSLWKISGAALALALAVLAGCAQEDKPASAKTSKFKVAKEEKPDAAAKPDETETPLATAPSGLPDEGDAPPPARKQPVPKPVASGALEAAANGELPDDPEQLMGLIKALSEREPRGRTRQEQLTDLAQTQRVRLAAAEKLMASKVGDEERHNAAQAKLTSLMMLSQLQDTKADEERLKFAESLVKDKYPPLAQLGRFVLFGSFVDEFANETPESGEPLVAKVKELLETDGTSQITLQIVSQAAQILERKGFREDAVKTYKLAAEKFAESDDKELASVAKQLAFKARMVEVDFETLLQNSMEGTDEDRQKLQAGFEKLAEGGPDETLLQLGSQAALPYMEIGQHLDIAKAIVETLEKTFDKAEDPDLQRRAKELVANARKRYALVGTELPVTGNQPDGTEFDWSAYKGKVVLLDFWATWCGPCLKEIPNIRENYETYKDRGFEVVGINIDEEADDLKQFLALQKLPWATVVSADKAARGFETPLAVQCGVTGIPFIVLIGKDGKVDSIQLRGPALGKRLAQLFPDEEKSEPKKEATGKSAPAETPEPKS